ncbi:hypothetical protein, partial [Staphylococcus aureus]
MRRLSFLATILALAALVAAAPRVAVAQDSQALVQRFATENFSEIAGAVTALAGSGSPQAAPVIEAL